MYTYIYPTTSRNRGSLGFDYLQPPEEKKEEDQQQQNLQQILDMIEDMKSQGGGESYSGESSGVGSGSGGMVGAGYSGGAPAGGLGAYSGGLAGMGSGGSGLGASSGGFAGAGGGGSVGAGAGGSFGGAGGGGGAGGAGGMGGAGIFAIVAAVIAGQYYTTTRTDTKFEGHETGNVFSGDFSTEPWFAYAHDKWDWEPTAGEKWDAAVHNDDWGLAAKRTPAMGNYWANPIGQWQYDSINEEVSGDVADVLDPVSYYVNKLGD